MTMPYAGKILTNNLRCPSAATAPALKIRFEIAATTMSFHPSSALSLPALTNCAVESVIASTSVNPDSATSVPANLSPGERAALHRCELSPRGLREFSHRRALQACVRVVIKPFPCWHMPCPPEESIWNQGEHCHR